MSTFLSLTLAVIASIGLLAAFYFAVLSFIGCRNRKARPSLELLPGGSPGTIGVAVRWDASVYAVQFWRIRLRFFSPGRLVKDAQFTVSFDSPQKTSFFVPLELPPAFRELVESSNLTNKAVILVEARGVENFTLAHDYRLPKFQKVYHASGPKISNDIARLPQAKEDAPAVMSLDYSELVVRRDRLKALAAQAKAKAKPTPVKAAAPSEVSAQT